MKSLEKFNLVEIPVVDQNNRIIAGNMRVQALRSLGRDDEEIEVRVPSRPLTEEEAREYLLRSNRNTAEWDWDRLRDTFTKDELINVGFEEWEIGYPPDKNVIDSLSNVFPDVEDVTPDSLAYKTVKVYFDSRESFGEFCSLVGDKVRLTENTRYIWYKQRPEVKIQYGKVRYRNKP